MNTGKVMKRMKKGSEEAPVEIGEALPDGTSWEGGRKHQWKLVKH